MKRFFLFALIGLMIGHLALAASTDVKGQIGSNDINLTQTDGAAEETFTRRTSTGGTITLDKLDGDDIPWSSGSTRTIRPKHIVGDNTGTISGYSFADIVSTIIQDNLIVNADVNSSAAIDASKIGGGNVSTTEYNYLANVTSDIQGQIDGKQAADATLTDIADSLISSPLTFADDVYLKFGADNDFTVRYKSADATLVIALDNADVMCTFSKTGGLTCTGEASFTQYNSTGTDNTYGINVMNTADPTGANLQGGLEWFNGTANMRKVRNQDNSATLEVFTSGAAHTTNFATSGTLTGGIMILDNVVSPTAAQCYGAYNNITTAGTVTLPPVVAGMSHCVGIGAAIEITLELDNADTFILNGVTMSAGEAIINTTAEAAGDYICVIGLDSTNWKVMGKQGTWTQATP